MVNWFIVLPRKKDLSNDGPLHVCGWYMFGLFNVYLSVFINQISNEFKNIWSSFFLEVWNNKLKCHYWLKVINQWEWTRNRLYLFRSSVQFRTKLDFYFYFCCFCRFVLLLIAIKLSIILFFCLLKPYSLTY